MLSKTRAIVLKSFKYGESGIVVQVYTEDFGRQSFIVHGARKKKSKFGYALFEALSLLDIDLYFKENRELQTLKEVKPAMSLLRIRTDIRRSAIAVFISEILFRTLKEIEPDRPLFNYLFHAIQVLEIAEKGVENFHLIFLMQYSKYLGIFPVNSDALLSGPYTTGIKDLIDKSFQNMESLSISRQTRQELILWLTKYFTDHIDGMGEIKSLQVLQEIFQ